MLNFILVLIIFFLSYQLLKTKKQLKDQRKKPKPHNNYSQTTNSTISTLKKYPYRKNLLLTKPEYAFYQVLKTECDNRNLLICPKVRMEDFLFVTDEKNKLKYRGYIKSRHIDFLLCDNKLHLLAGIELDDASHNQKDRQEVDRFKDKVFETIDTPLYRIPCPSKTYKRQIRNLLNELLEQ